MSIYSRHSCTQCLYTVDIVVYSLYKGTLCNTISLNNFKFKKQNGFMAFSDEILLLKKTKNFLFLFINAKNIILFVTFYLVNMFVLVY